MSQKFCYLCGASGDDSTLINTIVTPKTTEAAVRMSQALAAKGLSFRKDDNIPATVHRTCLENATDIEGESSH